MRRPLAARSRLSNLSSHIFAKSSYARRLQIEALEDRRMLATINVLNTADSGLGSLRQAIIDANASPGADTIQFDSGVVGTINLGSQLPTITDNVTINGTGADKVTLHAGNGGDNIAGTGDGFRVFRVEAATTISGLKLTGGDVDTLDLDGGAIFADADLALDQVFITENYAFYGGGVLQQSGALSINSSTIADNHVRTDENLPVSQPGGDGGGILARSGATLNLQTSTVSLNTAEVNAGGIGAFGATVLNNGTIFNNSAGNLGGGIAKSGGGNLDVVSTIIAGNSASSFENVFGTLNVDSFNLIGGDPKLGALLSNGGAIPTHALIPGSAAIDQGDSPFGFLDQRGQAIHDFPNISGPSIQTDIGAFELQPADLPGSLQVSTATDVVDGDYSAGQLSLREAVAIANFQSGTDTITFDAALASQTITLSDGELELTEDVVITGLGADLLTIDANHQSRLFSIVLGTDATLSGLTLTRGDALGGSGGGAIHNRGVLSLDQVEITDSRALGGQGRGGAIYTGGPASTSLLRLTITRSTFAGNSALEGGAIFTREASANITQATITGNTADRAGGLSKFGGFGDIDIANSTITGNTAQNFGGGIEKRSAPGGLTLNNTILSGNELAGGAANNLEGTGNLAGQFNYFGPDVPPLGGNNIVNIDNQPLIGLLADNGGPTRTQLPLSISAVVNAGDPNFDDSLVFHDQRGVGFPRVLAGRVDIGAVETPAVLPSQGLIVSTVSDVVDGVFFPGQLSLREAIILSNEVAGANVITFADPLFSTQQVIQIGSQLPLILDELTINGPGADLLTIDAGDGTDNMFGTFDGYRHFQIANVVVPGVGVEISGLTLTGGDVDGVGGAISSDGLFNLKNSTISGNAAKIRGGGIYGAKNFTLLRSTVSGNLASGLFARGGGIAAILDVTLEDSTVSGNWAFGSDDSAGGGISGTNVILVGSTVAGNTVEGGDDLAGGGVSTLSTLTLSNSMVTSNVAFDTILLEESSDDINVVALLQAHGIVGDTRFDSTTIVETGLTPADIFAATAEVITSSGLSALLPTGVLADNGGPTQTVALLADGAAVDTGEHSGCLLPTFDQRGEGFARISNGVQDIGAFEVQVVTADFDQDGLVTGLDFLAWQQGVGLATAYGPDGDADNDLDADGDDLGVWELQYGQPAPLAASLDSAPVQSLALESPAANASTDDLIDAAIAWELFHSPEEQPTTLIDETPQLHETTRDKVFESTNLLVEPTVDRELATVASQREGYPHDGQWLDEKLLPQVFSSLKRI